MEVGASRHVESEPVGDPVQHRLDKRAVPGTTPRTAILVSAEAAALALKNSVNINCGVVYGKIPEAFVKGMVTEKEVDDALAGGLKILFRLGWFDEKAVKRHLGLPRSARIDVIISLGYPEKEEHREKVRRPLDEVRRYAGS